MTFANERIPKKFIGAVEDEWQLYSDNEQDYIIGAPIGFGASSIVYAAKFQPSGAKQPVSCALKVLDLDRLPPHALHLLERETQLMSLSKHPNVLRVRGTYMAGNKLYIAMRLMNAGSASDVMRYGWPGGMEEDVVLAILKQALEGLNYFHINGLIHRDVKAANLLIDDDGTVLLGDLGVAAFLWDSEDSPVSSSVPEQRRVVSFESTAVHSNSPPLSRPSFGKRKSFVGTPCWMAPEVIQRKKYDSKADIWSFGITALELTQGRPPRSREAPQKVLLNTVQNAPPTLDRTGGPHKYSRAFYEVVESCLMKDPAMRPTAAELLQTPFFRGAKRKHYLVSTVLKGLPPLTQRQERKRVHPTTLQNTVASWDFSLTHQASPTVPAFRNSLSRSSMVSLEADVVGEPELVGTVFELDEDQAKEAKHESPNTETDDPSDSSISTPGPSTPGSANTPPPCFETHPPLPPPTLHIPATVLPKTNTSTPSPLPCLTPQSARSSPDKQPLTPSSAPFEKRPSKLWRRFARSRDDKLDKKGPVSMLDRTANGASGVARSVSTIFGGRVEKP